MLDGNVLLRQKRDEVPKGTLSCPYRNMANSHRHCHNEGVRLLPSTCDCELIQQTLFKVCQRVQIYKIKQYHVVVRVFFFMVYPENGVIEYPKTCLACPNRLFGFSK